MQCNHSFVSLFHLRSSDNDILQLLVEINPLLFQFHMIKGYVFISL